MNTVNLQSTHRLIYIVPEGPLERYINLTALQLKVGIFEFSVYVLLPLKFTKSTSSVEYAFEHYRIENYGNDSVNYTFEHYRIEQYGNDGVEYIFGCY